MIYVDLDIYYYYYILSHRPRRTLQHISRDVRDTGMDVRWYCRQTS